MCHELMIKRNHLGCKYMAEKAVVINEIYIYISMQASMIEIYISGSSDQ